MRALSNYFVMSLLLATSAYAHVSLPPGGAAAGSVYTAAFRVGHVCKGSDATTAITLRLPAGFTLIEAQPRPQWRLSSSQTEVTWAASSPQAAIPHVDRPSFVVRGQLTDKPGPLWFKVLQSCDKGSTDWAQIPAREGDKPAFPAARLDVLPPDVAAVDVREAWARVAVAGQSATGVFAKLTAPSGARLVGGSSPVADRVEVHEMKMDADVMRMRVLERGLALPAGETVDLRSGAFHLMLMGLKQALPAGSAVPLVLNFIDLEGRESSLQIQVPVMAGPITTSSTHEHHSHGP
jgi:periplasmic copper chaperone A